MKLRDIYEKAVQAGIEHDLRGKEYVLKDLERKKKDFDDPQARRKGVF